MLVYPVIDRRNKMVLSFLVFKDFKDLKVFKVLKD